MGAFESGSAFLAGVLAKLPENLRAQAKTLFEDPAAKDAVVVIGDGTLARPEFSKAMDDLKKKETELHARQDELTGWFNDNKAALDEYVAHKADFDKLKGGTPPPVEKPTVAEDPRKIAQEVLAEAGQDYIKVSAWLAGKAQEHRDLLGERLDTMALVNNPKLGRPVAGQPGRVFSLQDAYDEVYGARVAEKTKEIEEKRFNDEVEKRLKARDAERVGQPFPLRDGSPSVLDVLQTKEGPAAHTLDSAVAAYERLQETRPA